MKTYEEMIHESAKRLIKATDGAGTTREDQTRCDGFDDAIAMMFDRDANAVKDEVWDLADKIVKERYEQDRDGRALHRWTSYWNNGWN